LILAKNLVGKQFGKGFYESKDLTDFENFKEGDKKIHTKYLLNVKGGFSWNQIRTVNAIILRIKMLKMLLEFLEILLQLRWNRNRSHTDFWCR
jgi:hypothetical protein